MAEEKFNAIVLKAADFAEADKILWLYSAEKGKFSAVIKGVKKAAAKLKFAAMPFCFGEFLFASKGGGRLIVTGCTAYESFFSLRKDLTRFYAASAALDIIYTMEVECGGENLGQGETFLLLLRALKQISGDDNEPHCALIKFILEYIRLSGYGEIALARGGGENLALNADGRTLEVLAALSAADGGSALPQASKNSFSQAELKTALGALDTYLSTNHAKIKSLKCLL